MLLMAAVVGGVIGALIVLRMQPPSATRPSQSAAGSANTAAAPQLAFNPPRPEDAPPELREAVMYGYNLLTDTRRYARDHVGNYLRCTNCHFDGGRAKDGIPLVGVAVAYPKYRQRTGYATDLVARTNECFERSMNGKPLDADSKEMQAIMAYLQWISKDLPIYARLPWLGVKKVKSNHQPNAQHGATVYASKCGWCHGAAGLGTADGPPLWGPHSFNDGAGMANLDMLAGFAHSSMPKGSPDLTAEQALDVAAYITAKPRPHFEQQPTTNKSQANH